MTRRDVVPIERAGAASAVLKYSPDGHGGGNGRPAYVTRPPRQKKESEEENTGIRFSESLGEALEFQVMLERVMEGNRKMRETARSIAGLDVSEDLTETASAFGFYRGFVFRMN